jgi:hypothetical protein
MLKLFERLYLFPVQSSFFDDIKETNEQGSHEQKHFIQANKTKGSEVHCPWI